jgi:hypothetical protein
VLAAGENHATNSNHFHVVDGFPDDGKGVVPDFPVGDEIIGADQVPGLCPPSEQTR